MIDFGGAASAVVKEVIVVCVERNRPGAARRAWRRLHFSTWLLMAVPAAILALAILPGENVVIFRERYEFSPEETTCEHGWPCTWLVRKGMDGSAQSAWAFADDFCYIDWPGGMVDLLVALVLLALIAAVVEWRRRRRRHVWQFTIGDLLAGVLLTSIPLAWTAKQREAWARLTASAQGTDWAERIPCEIALPTWLAYSLGDCELLEEAIWWSGVVRPDRATFDLPADQPSLAVARAMLDCGAQNIGVCVESEDQSDDEAESAAFDAAALRSLTRLQHLFLERADDEVLACLDYLPDLRSLTFDEECGSMSAEGAARLKRLTRLRSLRGSRKSLGDGIANLASLTQLEALSLAGASDADAAQLAKLTRLRHLELRNASITDQGLASLANLTRLETLSLQSLQITGSGLASFNGAGRLRTLNLFGCGLTDEGLSGVRNLSSLTDLCLYYTPITGPGLVHLTRLTQLRRLDLSSTEINEAALESLPDLPALEELSLISTRTTANSLKAINRLHSLCKLCLVCSRVASFRHLDLNRLPKLTSIHCEGSWITHEELLRLWAERAEIEFIPRGQRLNLYGQFQWLVEQAHQRPNEDRRPIRVSLEGSDFGDREVAMLAGLASLEALRLESTRVTDGGLAALSEFQRLQEVDLTDTPISDAGLALLSSLPELKRLDVSYTEVTAKGIATLRDFEALEVIAFDPSQITVGIVEYLRRIRTLKRVTINRQRAPWGKQYHGARDFDKFLAHLRDDLPAIEVSVKDFSRPFHCVDF